MRLVTYRQGGVRRTGAMLDDKMIVDLNRASGGILPTDMIALLEGGDSGIEAARTEATEAYNIVRRGAEDEPTKMAP